jgi:hypothetical protein
MQHDRGERLDRSESEEQVHGRIVLGEDSFECLYCGLVYSSKESHPCTREEEGTASQTNVSFRELASEAIAALGGEATIPDITAYLIERYGEHMLSDGGRRKTWKDTMRGAIHRNFDKAGKRGNLYLYTEEKT